MLRWSAHETGRTVDVGGVADPAVDPLLPGGRQLVAIGRSKRRPRRSSWT
jgi:hypothetical protein